MATIHNDASPMAGKWAKIKENTPELGGKRILIEDWWDRLMQKGWGECTGNMACIRYAMRLAEATVNPSYKTIVADDNVVYGKINGLGYLVHISEFENWEDFIQE
jgi:hypothetical protein